MSERIKSLMEVADDGDRAFPERSAAFQEAAALRRAAKLGWAKLGWDPDRVAALQRTILDLSAAALDDAAPIVVEEPEEPIVLDHVDSGLPGESGALDGAVHDFEMGGDELADQAGRAPTDEANDAVDAALAPKARARRKAAAAASGEPRGMLTRLVESLLMDAQLSYHDVVEAVVSEFPKAGTSSRSVASVAAAMRRGGRDVPMRRRVAAEA